MNVNPASSLLARYCDVRSLTEQLAEPLSPEDQTAQSMPDTSPTKWHRAHVTWFFETFVLEPHDPGFAPFDESFRMLFNSYYEAVGPKYPRPQRGLVTRPGASEVGDYRRHVDERMVRLLSELDGRPSETFDRVTSLVTLGLNHEQQHQELLLMDIKHLLSHNPEGPVYRPQTIDDSATTDDVRWIDFDGGLVEGGHDGAGFAFDNESPRHRHHLEPFRISDRLVTVGEWRAFIADGGYRRAELWLSDGWHLIQAQGWERPIYWLDQDATSHTLGGIRQLADSEPVSHISFYEADAFARWADSRLPTELEWEYAVDHACSLDRGFDIERLDPAAAGATPDASPGAQPGMPIRQAFGDCWQWTSSAYLPYPGFEPPAGAVGEYNAKFMSNQMVLRGSSAFTPPGHARSTYRNFFPSSARWPLTGLRLAQGVRR